MFDNPDLALQTFSHGAEYTESISGKQIGNYSLNLSLATKNFPIDEVVARRDNIGFVAMVLHGAGPDRLDLATTVAQTMNNSVQKILGK